MCVHVEATSLGRQQPAGRPSECSRRRPGRDGRRRRGRRVQGQLRYFHSCRSQKNIIFLSSRAVSTNIKRLYSLCRTQFAGWTEWKVFRDYSMPFRSWSVWITLVPCSVENNLQVSLFTCEIVSKTGQSNYLQSLLHYYTLHCAAQLTKISSSGLGFSLNLANDPSVVVPCT